MIERRRFMAMLGTLGLGALLPRQAISKERIQNYYPHLLAVLEQRERKSGFNMTLREKENLRYACERINPENHEELAFVVAVGPKWVLCNDLVDEYVRRRAGQKPLIADSALLSLDKWAVPDTHRIPIYREQLVVLLCDLLDVSKRDAEVHFRLYLKSEAGVAVNLPPLGSVASVKYKKHLTAEEFERLEQLIRFCGPRSMPYTYCSTIACLAEKLMKENT